MLSAQDASLLCLIVLIRKEDLSRGGLIRNDSPPIEQFSVESQPLTIREDVDVQFETTPLLSSAYQSSYNFRGEVE